MRDDITYVDLYLSVLITMFGSRLFVTCLGCPKPEVLIGGKFWPIKEYYDISDSIYYVCDNKDSLINRFGETSRICLRNGEWSEFQLYCGCRKPDIPLRGTIFPRKELYNVNETVRYVCNTEKQDTSYFGNYSRTCLNSGTWSGIMPHCGCRKPLITSKGRFWPVKEFYDIDEIVQYICNISQLYVQQFGKSYSTCLKNGAWDGDYSDCDILCSEQPPALKNGVWTNWESGRSYRSNSILRAVCKPGYKIYGEPITTTCSSDGTWSSTSNIDHCQPFQCLQEPPTVKNGIWSEWEKGMIYYTNFTLEAVCKPGYTNNGQPIVVICSSEGSWLPQDSLLEHHCKEKSKLNLYYLAIPIVGVGVLLILLCFRFNTLWTRVCFGKRNKKLETGVFDIVLPIEPEVQYDVIAYSSTNSERINESICQVEQEGEYDEVKEDSFTALSHGTQHIPETIETVYLNNIFPSASCTSLPLDKEGYLVPKKTKQHGCPNNEGEKTCDESIYYSIP